MISELTTYDEDGYVIGQRVSVKRPRPLHLDEISLTVGYLAADPREIPISTRTKYLDDAPNVFTCNVIPALKRTGLFQ